MAVDTSQSPDTLAALLAEARLAAIRPVTSVLGLPAFFGRYLGKTNPPQLASGLEAEEAASLASAIAAALHEITFPITSATFQPENIRLKLGATGWKATLTLETGAALSQKASQATFGGLLYQMVEGREFAADFSGRQSQIAQLRQNNPYLANVLEEAVAGKFSSAEALAGGFGWSLYRKTHLNHATPAALEEPSSRGAEKAKPVAQLPGETAVTGATANRARVGPLALVSLAVALVLLAGMVLFSITDLDNTYQQRSQVLPTRTALPTAAPTATPAQALVVNRQQDGATLTRYNPALDQKGGEQYVDPAKLAAGQVATLTNFNIVQVDSAHWSADGQKVDLAMTNGGWETWDLATGQRLARQEIPNIEQYLSVSWSPDGQNFVAVGMDGQMRLGKKGQVVRTVAYDSGDINSGGSAEYPSEYSWSPDGNFLLMTTANNHLQYWNFQNTPTQVDPAPTEDGHFLVLRGYRLKGQIVWSADSRYLARIVVSRSTPLLEIYNSRNLAQLYEIEISDPANLPGAGQIDNPYSNEQLTLAWSPDSRYLAVSRPYESKTSGSATNYISTPEGSLVKILEIPDLATATNPGLVVQPTPRPQTRTNITPAASGNPSGIAVYLGGVSLQPLHAETVVLPGLTNYYYFGGQLAWSGDNRLVVMGGNATVTIPSQTPAYRGITLRLASGKTNWHWQIEATFDLPFEVPQFSAWLPDNRHLLYNTNTNQLGLALVPDRPNQPLTTEIYHQATSQTNLDLLPSPDGRFFLQTAIRNNKPILALRETASGSPKSELAIPEGEFTYTSGTGKWSSDGRYLAMPFVVENNITGGTPNIAGILRSWRVWPDKAPELTGDLLVPTFLSSSFDINNNLEWDNGENGPALLFEYEGYNIGRWDLTRPLPSLTSQESEVVKNSTNLLTSDSTWTYFQPVGRILGKVSSGGSGNWAWLPDHKHTVFCNTQCYIQELLSPGATYSAEMARGIRFDPQPLGGTARSSTDLTAPVVSPDGRMIVIALPGGLLNLYDATTGKLFNSFNTHQGSISSVAFSPESRYLATGGSDRAVKVWDTASWRTLAVLRVVTTASSISRLEWLPDNKTLAVGANYHGSLLYWRALA